MLTVLPTVIHGTESNIIRVKLFNSSVTTQAGLTGLTIASTGLLISTIVNNAATSVTYGEAAGTLETIATLGTYAAPSATKCRFKEVDSTNHPGLYEIQLADARFAVVGAKELHITITGATNLANAMFKIPLWSPYLNLDGPSIGPSTGTISIDP